MQNGSIGRRALLGAGFLATCVPGKAQASYPIRPIRLVAPQPPGGGFDLVARVLSEPLGRALGQPVVVENRSGAGTLIGTDFVAKAAADGYTLLVGSVSNLAINMGLYSKPPYDSIRDFQLIDMAVAYSYALVARKDLGFNNLQQLIAHARANPRSITYASAGNGSGQHVLAAALWSLAGVELLHVPYKGAQAAYMDMAGGRVDLFFDLAPAATQQITAGYVRPLAVSGKERLDALPGVPTVQETGVAVLHLDSWLGVFAPSQVPPPIVQRLQSDLRRVVSSPAVKSAFSGSGGRPMNMTHSEGAQLVKSDIERWSSIVKKLRITIE